jgi:prepilin-type N-terminal cleavage/methylation domain-containing protein
MTTAVSSMEGQKGFTLLEVVIAMAVLLVVFGAVLQMFIHNIDAQVAAENYMVVSQWNQLGLRKMAEELMGTDEELVNVSFSGSQGSQTLAPLYPGGGTATVMLYSSVTFKKITGFDMVAGSQVWSDDITFRLNATANQVERVENGVVQRLASYASALSFYNSPDGAIGIIFTTRKGNLTTRGPTGAEITDRMEVYPVNKGTD